MLLFLSELIQPCVSPRWCRGFSLRAVMDKVQLLDVPKATAALVFAASEGKEDELRALLQDCLLIDHTAVTADDCRPVPADLAREEDGVTALVAACERGHTACVALLLHHGAAPGKATRSGLTPVMACCYRGHADCLAACLEAGASPHEGTMVDKDGQRRTPIVLALERLATAGDAGCATQLLAHDPRLGARASPAQRDAAAPYYAEALVTSCGSRRTASVELLLQAKVDPNAPASLSAERPDVRILPLEAAISIGELSCVHALVSGGAAPECDASSTDGTPLQLAIRRAGSSEAGHACVALLERVAAARRLVGQRVELAELWSNLLTHLPTYLPTYLLT